MTGFEFFTQVEFREDVSRAGPGRLTGVLLTYGQRANDRPEVFDVDSLVWAEGGVVLNLQHNRQRPLIRFSPFVEGREVRMDVQLPDTLDGRDAATLVRNGTLTGLSVEFRPLAESEESGVRHIRAAELLGAGLVDTPAYNAPVGIRWHNGRRAWWL